MNVIPSRSRRCFLSTTGALAAAATLLRPGEGRADAATSDAGPWLRKTLKGGMIKVSGNGWKPRFQAAKAAGFAGVELSTRSGLNVDDAVAASKATGLVIDGTVGGYHWQVRHTDPDPEVRKRAQKLLRQSLKQTAGLGASTFLIVPGHGKDGTDEEVRNRATEAIEQALPLAEKLDVHILVENVWNDFLYDHDGGTGQSAQPLADFIASFDTPLVGTQFDLGNHWKYGDVAQWVRTLDKHIQKLDIKGFSREKGGFTDVTEGDIDWDSVRAALADIGFTGWLAAEVGGGDPQRLEKIAGQLDTALHCDKSLAAVRQETRGSADS